MHKIFVLLEICLLVVAGISGYVVKKACKFTLTHALVSTAVMFPAIFVFMPREEWKYGARIIIAIAVGMLLQEILSKPRR